MLEVFVFLFEKIWVWYLIRCSYLLYIFLKFYKFKSRVRVNIKKLNKNKIYRVRVKILIGYIF